jgi:hypothetical protein
MPFFKCCHPSVQELFGYAVTSMQQPPAAAAEDSDPANPSAAAAEGEDELGLADELAQSIHVGEGFDAEQIWLQLELLTGPLLKRSRKLLYRLKQQPPDSLVSPEVEEGLDAVLGDIDEEEGGSEGSSEGGVEESSQEGEEEEVGSQEGGEIKVQKPPKKKAKLLPVEDR